LIKNQYINTGFGWTHSFAARFLQGHT